MKTVMKILPGFLLSLAIAAVAKFIESLFPIHLIGASVIALFIGKIKVPYRNAAAIFLRFNERV